MENNRHYFVLHTTESRRASYSCSRCNSKNCCKAQRYHSKVPFISRISPTMGPRSGNVSICIYGYGFNKVQKVNVGQLTITIYKTVNNKKIIVDIPKIDNETEILITVSTNCNTSNSVFYKIIDPPIITGVDGIVGSMGPFTIITLHGNNFSTLKKIYAGDITLSKSDTKNVTVVSDNTINFIIFLDNCTNIPIRIKTVGGVSNLVYYSKNPPPMI